MLPSGYQSGCIPKACVIYGLVQEMMLWEEIEPLESRLWWEGSPVGAVLKEYKGKTMEELGGKIKEMIGRLSYGALLFHLTLKVASNTSLVGSFWWVERKYCVSLIQTLIRNIQGSAYVCKLSKVKITSMLNWLCLLRNSSLTYISIGLPISIDFPHAVCTFYLLIHFITSSEDESFTLLVPSLPTAFQFLLI